MSDGSITTLADMRAEVERSIKGGNPSAKTMIVSIALVHALINKIEQLDPGKEWTIFWLNGYRKVIKGQTIQQACANAGISSDDGVAFYSTGDNNDFVFNTETRKWVDATTWPPEGQVLKKKAKV